MTVWDSNTLLGELQLPLLSLLDSPAEPGILIPLFLMISYPKMEIFNSYQLGSCLGTWWKLQVGKTDSFVSGDLKVRIEKPLGASYLTVTGTLRFPPTVMTYYSFLNMRISNSDL